jgi:hypothetical protein
MTADRDAKGATSEPCPACTYFRLKDMTCTKCGYPYVRPPATPPAPDPASACHWRADDDGNWDTDCGQCFCLTDDGTPTDHGLRYCGYCGLALVSVPYEPEPDEEAARDR